MGGPLWSVYTVTSGNTDILAHYNAHLVLQVPHGQVPGHPVL